MIINNSSYLNYLDILQKPSNDINTIDNNMASNNNENSPITVPSNMDSVDISNIAKVDEEKIEIIDKSKFNWTYNTTDDGYLPDFKLGDWENTSETLFGGNTIAIEENLYAIYLPEKLQEKMEKDPEFAKEINAKIEDFFNSAKKENGILEDGTEYNVIAQQMALSMDENGNIIHTYVRTESYSISNALQEAANDENALDNFNNNTNTTGNKSLTIKYGFAMYQSNIKIDNKYTSDEEKNKGAMSVIGVQAVITIETSQINNNEPEIEIRKANGDIIELETGKLIQKHTGYSSILQKYDKKV